MVSRPVEHTGRLDDSGLVSIERRRGRPGAGRSGGAAARWFGKKKTKTIAPGTHFAVRDEAGMVSWINMEIAEYTRGALRRAF